MRRLPAIVVVALVLAAPAHAGAPPVDARAYLVESSTGEVLASPHVWLGSLEQICDALAERRRRWGVSYWTVPATAMEAVAPIIDRLAGT